MKIRKIGKVVFFVVVVVLLVILGVFLWRFYNPDIGLVMFDEFKVQQTADAKIISHAKTGFSMSVPSDWEVLDAGIGFSLKDSKLELEQEMSQKFLEPVPQKGCAIHVEIKEGVKGEEYSDYQDVIDTIEFCLYEMIDFDCGYKVEEINGIKSLVSVSGEKVKELNGKRIRIQIPKNNNVYIFEAFLFGEDKDQCENELYGILETAK